MGLENINKVYAGLQYDGAHYSESQAQRLSLDFNRRLNKIIQH
jgi:hypothetical protein